MAEFLKEKLDRYSNDKIAVFLVDGEYVRDNLFIDFTEGGHDLVYDWIPDGEAWLDFDVAASEIKFVLLHELHERNQMSNGMDYDHAHDAANIIENEARHNPDKVEDMIMQELSQIKSAQAVEVKNMPNKIFKTMVCGVHEVADRVLEFIGSTEQKDRVGDVVKADGWKLGNYLKNPVFLWAHDYHQPPIGKATKAWVQEGKLMFRIQFPDAETYSFADTIYKLYKGGYLNATSVGFAPDDDGVKVIDGGGSEYTSQELLELSAIPVPANPDALVSAREAGLITVKEFEVITKPEETENYVRIPVESPDKHSGHRIRTISISDEQGIKALYCGECKKVITYLFNKDKGWTMAKAEAWVKDHKSFEAVEMKTTQNSYSQNEIRDELDYLRAILLVSTLSEENKNLFNEIMRLSGNDIPVDISKQMSRKLQTAIKDAFDKVSGWADGCEKTNKESLKAFRDIVKANLGLLLPPPQPPAEEEPAEDGDKALEGGIERLIVAVDNTRKKIGRKK